MLQCPDEGIMCLDGFVLEIVLIEELAIHCPQKETATSIEGSSDAYLRTDSGDYGGTCISFQLFDTGYLNLQVLQRRCDVRCDFVFLLDIDDESFLVDELGWGAVPLLRLALLHLFYLLQVALTGNFGLREEALQVTLEQLHLRLYLPQQLACPQTQLGQGLETGLGHLVVRERQYADEVLVILLEGGADGCSETRLCGGAVVTPDFVTSHDEEAVVGLFYFALRTSDGLQADSLLCQSPLHNDYFSRPPQTPTFHILSLSGHRYVLFSVFLLQSIMYTKYRARSPPRNFKVNLIDEPPLTQPQKTYLMNAVPKMARTTPSADDFQVELSKDLCREFKQSVGVSAMVKPEDYNPDKEEKHLKPCSFRFTINEFLFRVWIHQPEVEFEPSIRAQ